MPVPRPRCSSRSDLTVVGSVRLELISSMQGSPSAPSGRSKLPAMPDANTFEPGRTGPAREIEGQVCRHGAGPCVLSRWPAHADFPTYWDYINLDTLLSLQHPVTPFPDEQIFIIYHQTTELYFKLSCMSCATATRRAISTAAEMLEACAA